MPESSETARRRRWEVALLYDVSQTLDSSMELRDVLSSVLEAIAGHMGMGRGMLALLNRQTGQIQIDAAYGISDDQRRRARYRVGEGVTGRVFATGQPAVVPRIAEEPAFLDRTGARKGLKTEDISFICVPVRLDQEVVGTLSADRPYDAGHDLDEDVRMLMVVASMIAQAVRLRQEAHEERQRLVDENVRLQQELQDRFRPSNIIGNSTAMQDVYDLIGQVRQSDATVLIRGESGVGKELVAQAIHYNSPRASQAFVKVNCAALPETVLESELFGHEKGAFTGAVARRKGRFELAHGGTIFLDEIGDLSPATQIRFLRVLQEREFERVGGAETLRTDVRVLAATNRDLEEMVGNDSFRQDLYYRLNVFPIHVPPLRDRKADIVLLADYFVEKYGRASGKNVRRISTPAIDMLTAYHWPGNVRELENCIERAVLMTNDDVIHGHHLPPSLQTAEASGTVADTTLAAAIERLERELITDALKSARGNRAKAARALGLTERIMGLRVAKYGIDSRRFRTNR